VLEPHQQILQRLTNKPIGNGIPTSLVPALSVLRKEDSYYAINNPTFHLAWKNSTHCPITFFDGGLTVDDCARINNWIYHNLAGAQKLPLHQLEMSIAHARTLLLLCRYSTDFEAETEMDDSDVNHCLLKQAWIRLVEYTGFTVDGKHKIQVVDVDLESLKLLEQSMFDRSEQAGAAGNMQWGLNQGPHEADWFPYNGPEENDEHLRTGHESECDVCVQLQNTL